MWTYFRHRQGCFTEKLAPCNTVREALHADQICNECSFIKLVQLCNDSSIVHVVNGDVYTYENWLISTAFKHIHITSTTDLFCNEAQIQ